MALPIRSKLCEAQPTLGENRESDVGPFRFLDLPRELRNDVYSGLTRDTRGGHFDVERPTLDLTAFRQPDIRLVCRQIQEEYDDEVLRFATLTIKTGAFATSQGVKIGEEMPKAASLLKIVRNVTLQFDACLSVTTGDEYHRTNDVNDAQELVRMMIQTAGEVTSHMRPSSTLRLELVLDIDSLELLEKEKGLAQSFFQLCSRSNAAADAVDMHPFLFIQYQLFRTNDALLAEAHLAGYMDNTHENAITYRAKLCSDDSNWHGLELTTHCSGTWDYEAILEEAQLEEAQQERERNERYDSDDHYGDGNDTEYDSDEDSYDPYHTRYGRFADDIYQ